MTNEIYTLVDPDCISKDLPSIESDGHIANIARIAATMKTAVWIDPTVSYLGRRELDIFVAAGQMTCCYNLMHHIRERFVDEVTGTLPTGSAAESLYLRLLTFWQRFEAEPFALVDQRKQEVGLPVAN